MTQGRRATPQLSLQLPQRGGRRRGAGRKPRGARAGVSHHGRPAVSRHHPAHVTLRVRDEVWNLRSRRCFGRVAGALCASRDRAFMRVVHFSVQGNHLHLIVEADGAANLARGMKGLTVRLARALNRLMSRRGSLFADRYHAHVLRTPAEVRRAIAYVLGNRDSHLRRLGSDVPSGQPDPFSSAVEPGAAATSPPRSLLLAMGWRSATP